MSTTKLLIERLRDEATYDIHHELIATLLAAADVLEKQQEAKLTDSEIIEVRKSVKGSGREPWSDTLAFGRALLERATK